VKILLKRLEEDSQETKVEILYLIKNLLLRGKASSLQVLLSLNFLESLQLLFKDKYFRIKLRLLEIFEEILKIEDIDKEILEKLLKIDLYQFLGKTMKSKNGQISKSAERMLDKLDQAMETVIVGEIQT
jgi:hypothetical protein